MTKWRRTSVLSDRRTVMLGEELMRFVDYNEDGCRKHRYRIHGTQVYRKFYLRARHILQRPFFAKIGVREMNWKLGLMDM